MLPHKQIETKLSLTDLLTRDDILRELNTRDCILAHGVRLFHLHGVDGTSVGRILESTGKSKSQFYSHFKDKDDFICSVLELEMTTLLRIKKRNPLRNLEDFDTWFAPYLELAHLPHNLGCPVGPLATELSPSNDKVRKVGSEQLKRWEHSVADSFRVLGCAEGFSEPFNPRTLARHFCCSVQGAYLFGRVHRDPSFLEEVGQSFKQELHLFKSRSVPSAG